MSAPFQFYYLSLVKESVIQVSKNIWSYELRTSNDSEDTKMIFVSFTLELQV